MSCIFTFEEPKVNRYISRPISGTKRKIEMEKMNTGNVAPLKEHAKRIGHIASDVFMSGNRDDMGTTSQVLKLISYEGRIKDRLNCEELDSFMRYQLLLGDEDKGHKVVKGFIHFISVEPVIIFLWTRASFELYHDMCQMDVIYWDATGHIVKTKLTNNKLFYYELTGQNPSSGKISIPLSIMLSSDHTQPTIQFWISMFRNYEKILYGASDIAQPIQINSDRAMTFVITATQVFNGESLLVFLTKSMEYCCGNGNVEELTKTIVHTCAFNFMRNARDIVKSRFSAKRSQNSCTRMLSLLMNCSRIVELDNLRKLIINATCSRFLTRSVEDSVKHINKCIKDFKNILTLDDERKKDFDKRLKRKRKE